MDYIKIKFGNNFDQPGTTFEKTIEDMFRLINPRFTLSEDTWKPYMDIYETSEEIIVVAEMPGVKKENLGIEINRKTVKIYGKRVDMMPFNVNNVTYRLAEIQYGKFERFLLLPAPIDTEKVTATYSNGFLHIRFVKLPINKIYKIPISTG